MLMIIFGKRLWMVLGISLVLGLNFLEAEVINLNYFGIMAPETVLMKWILFTFGVF